MEQKVSKPSKKLSLCYGLSLAVLLALSVDVIIPNNFVLGLLVAVAVVALAAHLASGYSRDKMKKRCIFNGVMLALWAMTMAIRRTILPTWIQPLAKNLPRFIKETSNLLIVLMVLGIFGIIAAVFVRSLPFIAAIVALIQIDHDFETPSEPQMTATSDVAAESVDDKILSEEMEVVNYLDPKTLPGAARPSTEDQALADQVAAKMDAQASAERSMETSSATSNLKRRIFWSKIYLTVREKFDSSWMHITLILSISASIFVPMFVAAGYVEGSSVLGYTWAWTAMIISIRIFVPALLFVYCCAIGAPTTEPRLHVLERKVE